MINVTVQLSLGQEFGPAQIQFTSPEMGVEQPAAAGAMPDAREDKLIQALEITLSHLLLAVIANEKLQESIDDNEVREGAEVLRGFSPPMRAFVEATAQEWQLSEARLESRVVAKFGRNWRLCHLLEYEGDDDDEPAANFDVGAASDSLPPVSNKWPFYLQVVSPLETATANATTTTATPQESESEGAATADGKSQEELPL